MHKSAFIILAIIFGLCGFMLNAVHWDVTADFLSTLSCSYLPKKFKVDNEAQNSSAQIKSEADSGSQKIKASEKNTTQDSFEFIKECVTKSAFRIKDWKQAASFSKNEWILSTSCHYATRYIISLLTGISTETLENRFQGLMESHPNDVGLFNTSAPLLDDEFYGTLNDFFAGTSGIKMKLTEKSTESEHLIFQFAPNPWSHSFVIEKIGTKESTFWRIYQSFYQKFTLAQWIGIDKVCVGLKDEKCFDQNMFGMGKSLSRNDLLSYLYDSCHYFCDTNIFPNFKDVGLVPIYVRMFQVNPAFKQLNNK